MTPACPEELTWGRRVAEAHRADLFAALAGITWRLNEHPPPIPPILVGALSLLIRARLSYTVLWDIDLLFPDEEALVAFARTPVPPGLKVVSVDEEPTGPEYIRSMHTLWRAHRLWVNVDLMMRRGYYALHARVPRGDLRHRAPQTIDGCVYEIDLSVAHPWNIFIDKITSPRLRRSIDEGDMWSIDLRHASALLRLDDQTPGFWEYVRERVGEMGTTAVFEGNLRLVRELAPRWGDDDDGLGGLAGPPA